MSLSFEESKKMLQQQAATPSVMSLRSAEPAVAMYSTEEDNFTIDDRYDRYDDYEDKNVSLIEEKTIHINGAQINLTQESYSQYIPFQMPRYYDGFDLSSTLISFHYVRADGKGAIVPAVNVSYNESVIKFAWLVDQDATFVEGILMFEIQAIGVNSLGNPYVWKSQICRDILILKALPDPDAIDHINEGTWVETIVQKVVDDVAEKIVEADVGAQVTAAEEAATRAEEAAEQASTIALDITDSVDLQLKEAFAEHNVATDVHQDIREAIPSLDGYATEDFVMTKISEIPTPDVSGQIATHNEAVDAHQDIRDAIPSLDGYATEEFVTTKISEIPTPDVSGQIGVHNIATDAHQDIRDAIPSIEGLATETYVDEAIKSIDVTDQFASYYTIVDADSKFATKTELGTTNENIGTNTASIASLGVKVTALETAVKDMTDQSGYEYYATYGTTTLEATGEETENVFTLYEVDGDAESVKSQFVITGGSGGSTSATTLTVSRVTSSPLTITTKDKAIIEFNCTSYDADGETVDCSYTWKKNGAIIMSGALAQGLNTFDLTEFVTTGTHKFTLTVTDEGGSMSVKTWTVQMVDVRIESAFNDQVTYPIGKDVSFTYTPHGAIDKTVHFKLDGVELENITTSVSGLLQSYTLPAQTHGAHLLEVWITAEVNNVEIETEHIYKDIIWYDEDSDIPVIGCIYRYDHYGVVTSKQYNATDITYVVYDPKAANPTVDRLVGGESIGIQTLEKPVDVWSYKTADVGEKVLTITCGVTSVEVKLNIVELGITIEPVTANLAFDFNPTGYSNNDADRVWSDANTGVTMSVSDNFDWMNGGYQRDDNGDQYFCVKAGTTATINYNLFGADYDPKALGKEFKFVFKTTNVKNRNATFLSCLEEETTIGLDMKVETAYVRASDKELFVPYCEDDIIEFEYNINKMADIPLLMSYEDGVANRPLIYTSDSSFMQLAPQPITIGSTDCDVYVYRMKAYDTSLTDKEILANFIADARNADEMLARYNRNQIYDENNMLTPEHLAEVCPDLRIIMIEAPWFTNDKDDKVKGTTIRQIYKGGDAVYDNWTCTGARHSGQGTSSNKYGYAGRNIRLIMNDDESLFTFNGTDEAGNPLTGKTVTINEDSVPTDFMCIKVNIASSENQNNAQFAQRYNRFNPVVRPAKVADPRVKDTMEFVNCVVFIKETDTVQDANGNYTNHREFNDNAWHYYALGNVGDDKKTDKTRMNDAKDPKEYTIEIEDFDVPLAEFPTGIGGRYIAPEEFVAGNKAYDNLYSEYTYDEEGEFATFGAESYSFRYEMKGITDEQRQVNIDAWREFYKFVVTSTDEEFVAHFEDWFILDSALYYYLFTERYLMVDNRAKNSFWHRGKVYITDEEAVALGEKAKNYIIDNEKAAINEGYRYDLTMAYDMDTSLGIDNTGKLVLSYGQEDVDKDSSGAYIYRAAESNFFCKIRDLFADKLKGMFNDRETVGAWKSTSLISQWDEAQAQFPEELWRLDVERKYIRTYRGVSIDNSIKGAANDMFLEPMLNGRKKYQRRQFERNQELYMATKYVSTFAKANFIRLRFNNPTNAVVKQDYTLYLTPYTDMYISAEFGNTGAITFRAKAGVEYPVKRATESDTADIVLIYGASFIQAIGDLSKCYLGDNDFSMATRLQSLTIGSDIEGYENTFMAKLSVGNNKLLEYLDIRNVTGFTKAEGSKDPVINLANCNNLVELRAEGSTATGVIFANGGKLERAYLPAVTSMTLKNLQYLETLDVESYDNLQQLTVENTPAINTYELVNDAPKLNTIRLIGMNWDASYNIENTDVLDRLIEMRGIDGDNFTIAQSVLTGAFHAAVVKEKEKADYIDAWPFLTITENTLVNQFAVTFVNDDGTVLDVQYVDKGEKPVDPITRKENPIATPTKESTVSTNYTFAGWDTAFVDTFGPYTIKATYTETTRTYTVQYVSKNTTLQTTQALYGSTVVYNGDIPSYTAEESAYKYYLFDGWDKSGYVDGDKTINAVFDSCEYVQGYFEDKDLSTMRPVEVYAMTRLGLESQYVESKDAISIVLGSDFTYGDVEQEVLIDTKTTFDGTNYIDTGINLLAEDRSFVFAMDYEMTSGANEATLMQCYSSLWSSGIRVRYSNGVKCELNTTSTECAALNYREMLVIRHIQGEKGIHVYTSNTPGIASTYIELTASDEITHNISLVFGCCKMDNGSYKNYGSGVIYWSKLWYTDLGDDVCKELAYWPHEELTFEMAGFERYFLSDNSGNMDSMTFLANGVLSSAQRYADNSYHTGGWATSSLRTYLNDRIYKAFPLKWKQLLKQVKVKSSIGSKSESITSSDCYIFIPSIFELFEDMNRSPYDSEGTHISFCTDNTSRICKDKSGTAVSYWTRSPNVSYDNYIYSVTTSGSHDGYNWANNSNYVRIMISI